MVKFIFNGDGYNVKKFPLTGSLDVEINRDHFENRSPAGSLIDSIRNFGYDINSAVADLIDNSITATADRVEIHMEWNNGDPWIAIKVRLSHLVKV